MRIEHSNPEGTRSEGWFNIHDDDGTVIGIGHSHVGVSAPGEVRPVTTAVVFRGMQAIPVEWQAFASFVEISRIVRQAQDAKGAAPLGETAR